MNYDGVSTSTIDYFILETLLGESDALGYEAERVGTELVCYGAKVVKARNGKEIVLAAFFLDSPLDRVLTLDYEQDFATS